MLKDPIALSHGTLPQWDNALGICHLHVSSDRSCSASVAFLLRFHWILSLLFWITSILVYHNTLHQQITWQIRCCAEKVLLLEMTKSADWSFHWCPLVFKWKKYLRNIFLCTFIQIITSCSLQAVSFLRGKVLLYSDSLHVETISSTILVTYLFILFLFSVYSLHQWDVDCEQYSGFIHKIVL